ncbi:MAG: ABC transporter ATP-binding protein [Thiotrichaceae bacterium]|nr:ABC transporter ATP-binding protein [Thiotrichaceae bacterium]
MTKPLLQLTDISLSYGSHKVIQHIDLSLQEGEIACLLGSSGCGKTTLLRSIAGFEIPDKGRISLRGKSINDKRINIPPEQRNIGMVFQDFALFPHLSIKKNIAFGLNKQSKKAVSQRVNELLELIGMGDIEHKYPHQLSGGQQQRVALARTIVIEPRVLLLDEPLSNLDAKLRVHMRQELLELQRKLGLTTIFVTHDQEEANTTSDRIAVLQDGIVQQVGSPMELYDKPDNLFVAQFLGSANVLKGNIKAEGSDAIFEGEQGLKVSLNNCDVEGSKSIIFRPQNISLCDQSSSDADLNGIVKKREFLGNLVRYEIQVDQQQLLVDEIYGLGKDPAEEGMQVGLSMDSDHVIIM